MLQKTCVYIFLLYRTHCIPLIFKLFYVQMESVWNNVLNPPLGPHLSRIWILSLRGRFGVMCEHGCLQSQQEVAGLSFQGAIEKLLLWLRDIWKQRSKHAKKNGEKILLWLLRVCVVLTTCPGGCFNGFWFDAYNSIIISEAKLRWQQMLVQQ